MIKIINKIKDVDYKDSDIFLHHTGYMYGIGASIGNQASIEKISKLKERDSFKGFIVLFSSYNQLKEYNFSQLSDKKLILFLKQYFPGNLTILLKTEDERLKHLALSGKIAARVPNSGFLRSFLHYNGPIVSTSVNKSGEPFCENLKNINSMYSEWFDYGVLDENIKEDKTLPSTLIDFNSGQISLLREGSISYREIIESWEKPLLLFMCVGNICRSPLAEYYTKKIIEEENIPIRVDSAGLIDSGTAISKLSKEILKSEFIDASNHLSKLIDNDLIQKSTIILCMSKSIENRLKDRFPEAIEKIYTMSSFVGENDDIEDPYGLDRDAYNKAWGKIKQKTFQILEKVKTII